MEETAAKSAIKLIDSTRPGLSELLVRLCGPAADYYGQQFLNWAERRSRKLEQISEIAIEKAGKKIDEPGSIPPRVLKEVVEEGTFTTEQIAAEYYGGVLASSRSGVSRDDRGTVYAKLISQMTSYQLRFHCFSYIMIKRLFDGTDVPMTDASKHQDLVLWLSFEDFYTAMDIQPDEDFQVVFQDSILGCIRLKLLGELTRASPDEVQMKEWWPEAPGAGIGIQPNSTGASLFMWAMGEGARSVNDYLKSEVKLEAAIDFSYKKGLIPIGARKFHGPPWQECVES